MLGKGLSSNECIAWEEGLRALFALFDDDHLWSVGLYPKPFELGLHNLFVLWFDFCYVPSPL